MTATLDTLLLLGATGIPLAALLATARAGRWLLVGLYLAQLGVMLMIEPGDGARSSVAFHLLGHPVGWQLDALGWLVGIEDAHKLLMAGKKYDSAALDASKAALSVEIGGQLSYATRHRRKERRYLTEADLSGAIWFRAGGKELHKRELTAHEEVTSKRKTGRPARAKQVAGLVLAQFVAKLFEGAALETALFAVQAPWMRA